MNSASKWNSFSHFLQDTPSLIGEPITSPASRFMHAPTLAEKDSLHSFKEFEIAGMTGRIGIGACHVGMPQGCGLNQPWEDPASIEAWLEARFAGHSDIGL